MSVGTDEVINYYNNMLPKMEWYHSGNNARLNRANRSLFHIIKPKMSVLDVGCGTGITSSHMAMLGANVTAVDISPVLIDYAKKNSHHENIEYIVSDISKFYSNKKFDAIVFVDVIEHIEKSSFVATLDRLLKSNSSSSTVIYVNIPNGDFLDHVNENGEPQIIDLSYRVGELVNIFNWHDFRPIHMFIYDMQYNEFVFATKTFLCDYYKSKF